MNPLNVESECIKAIYYEHSYKCVCQSSIFSLSSVNLAKWMSGQLTRRVEVLHSVPLVNTRQAPRSTLSTVSLVQVYFT